MKRYIKSAIIREPDIDLDELDYRDILDLADRSTDPNFLRNLANSDADYSTKFLKSRIMCNPNTPVDVVLGLLPGIKESSARDLIACTSIHTAVLDVLANDPDASVRGSVLSNEHTDIGTVVRLLNDGTQYETADYNLVSFRDDIPDAELIKLYKSGRLDTAYASRLKYQILKRGLTDQL